ncbi:MAG: energy transducer TonB, partial [Terriglobales bacterium]
MAHQLLTPSETQVGPSIPELNLLLPQDFELSLWQSLRRQIHDWRHPQKLPPLHLTSKPVPVREIWGSYNYKKRGAVGSTILHMLAIGGIIAVSL